MSNHTFDTKQWAQLDVFNQMGNIGSEVGRAMNAKRQGNHRRMETAFYRGMDLINATVDAWVQQKKPATPELLIARELFAESVLTDKEDPALEQYFMDYAIAAKVRMML